MTEHNLLVFLVQVLVLLVLARSAGELLRHFGQAPIVGEILVGVLLGPTLLGRALPELHAALFPPDTVQRSMLDVVSWFGVLFLLLETGLHVDVSAAWRARGPALRIGVIGVLVPLLLGSALSFLLPDRVLADPEQRLIFALFLGTTMAISAMVIIARVLHDLDLVKSDLGLVTLCGYAVNDVLAWMVFSVVLGIATSAAVNLPSIGFLLLFTLVFTVLSLTLGLRLVDAAVARLGSRQQQHPGAVLTFVCCLGLACGALTQWVGLTALFGFFLAGIMAGEARQLTERTREIIGQMVHSIFVPLYFAGLALHLDFIANFDLTLVLFVTGVSIAAKFLGAWLGALSRDISPQDRVSIGIAFTPSGVTGIVVAGVALEYRIISTPVFVAIVCSAVASALLVAPWLGWSIRRRKSVDLARMLARAGVLPQLRAGDRFAAIRELCRAAAGPARMPVDEVTAAVDARERLMGTAIGKGVAVPHARIAALRRPVVAFGRAPAGLAWDAPDGEPVKFVFLVLTPARQEGLQLQILQAIGRTMSGDGEQRLSAAPDAAALYQRLAVSLAADAGHASPPTPPARPAPRG